MSKSIRAVAGCVFNDKEEVLLEYRKGDPIQELSNTWILPGGKIEIGETPEAAICRELYEETGYNAKVLYPVTVDDPYKFVRRLNIGGFYGVTLYTFRCDIDGYSVKGISEKNHRLRWIPFWELKWYNVIGESYETILLCAVEDGIIKNYDSWEEIARLNHDDFA